MRVQRKDRKKCLIIIILLLTIGIISYFCKSFAMTNYEETNFQTGMVTANALNVRQGPGFNYKVISKVYKNQYIRVFAKIGVWYVIQTDNDIIGVVNENYLKPIYQTDSVNTEIVKEEPEKKGDDKNNETSEVTPEANEIEKENANIVVSDKVNSSELTEDEKEVYELINQKRIENGLDILAIDDDVQNLCRIKASEMVEKEYFSHNSPTYGTIFEMIKNDKISYKVAGENIAGNSDNQKAVDAWMNSENHKANILSRNYNYTGIAVVNSPKYGKIFVQVFIGR